MWWNLYDASYVVMSVRYKVRDAMWCKLYGATDALQSIGLQSIGWERVDWADSIRQIRLHRGGQRGGGDGRRRGGDGRHRGGTGRHRGEKPPLTPSWLKQIRHPRCEHCLGTVRTDSACNKQFTEATIRASSGEKGELYSYRVLNCKREEGSFLCSFFYLGQDPARSCRGREAPNCDGQ
eukprot:4102147-Pyramimonas_sp.AAC.1